MELFPLLLGHLQVRDLFAAENHAIVLPADLSDDSKGTMTLNDKHKQIGQTCNLDTSVHLPIFSNTSYFSASDILLDEHCRSS